MRGHLEGGIVGHCGDGSGLRNLFWVGGHYAGDIRPDLEGFRLDGCGIKGGAEVRASTAKGADFAFPVLADEARSDVDFRTFHGLLYASVGFFLIVLYNKFSGVKPLGIEAFLLEFCGKDGCGKKFPEGNLLILWRNGKFTEKAVNPGLDFFPFFSGKKALHYVLVAFLHLGNCLWTAVQKGIRAAADGAGNKYHRTFLRFLFNYIQDPGHSRCAGYGTAAKL